MNLQLINLKQITPTFLIYGISGGGLLVLITIVSSKGWWIVPTYPILLLATVFALKAKKRIGITYLKAFATLVLTFMLMTYILYFYIINFENPNSGITLIGHAWRFFVMLGLGIVSSAIMSLFFLKTKNGKVITQTS